MNIKKKIRTLFSSFVILLTSYTSLAQCVPFSELEQNPILQFAHFGAIDMADIDNDGDQDLLISGAELAGNFIKNTILYQNDGVGNYSVLDDSTFSTDAWTIKFIDVDNDNDLDVFMSGQNPSANKLYLNNGLGIFSLDTLTSFPPIYNGSFDFGDLDADGDFDILIAGSNANLNFGNPVCLILENNGAGIFTELTGTSFTGVDFSRVSILDIDNDNDQDAIVSGTEIGGSHSVKLYLNDGLGNFTVSTNSPFDTLRVNSISYADLESDGDLDLLINYFDSSLRLYVNDSNGTFTESTPSAFEPVTAGESIFIDIENDGYQDIVSTGAGGGNTNVLTLVYKNNGGSTFSLLDSLVGVYGASIGTADINNDNFKDLVIMGNTNNFVPSNMDTLSRTRVYLNNSLDLTLDQQGNVINANEIGASITYQWLDCTNNYAIIPNEIQQSFSPNSNGSYAVEISENGCVDTSACRVISAVGILENNFVNEFKIYPNPTNGNFSIDLCDNHNTIKVKMTDLNGRLIQSKEYHNTYLLNMTIDEPAGVYLLIIESNNKKAVIRLVKE
ncbi:MAG: hypothetical protein ACI87N_002253 [Flavobacteriales bacterium]|jgi:hypothetical protein